jgi:regulator of sigma E protease
MLPIPGLDGARLAFVALEGIRGGRRVNPQVEGIIHFVGLMLLITLMLFVSYNDVRRLIPT